MKYKTNTKNNFGSVIILNGPSSVGKSSLIKEFQKLNSKPWLSIGIDNFFVGVLPPKFYMEDKPEHHTIMRGTAAVDENNNKIFNLEIGKEGQKVLSGMHRAIAAYAKAGNNVIVDYINYNPNYVEDLKKALIGINVVFVKITAPLEIIEEREKQRGTSPQGHARSHYHTVDTGIDYDLQINTADKNPEDAAKEILNLIQ